LQGDLLSTEQLSQLQPVIEQWFDGLGTEQLQIDTSDALLPYVPYALVTVLLERIRRPGTLQDVERARASRVLECFAAFAENRKVYWQRLHVGTSAYQAMVRGHWGGSLPPEIDSGLRLINDTKWQLEQARSILESDDVTFAHLASTSDPAAFWHSLFRTVRSAYP
jgi:hypothetical protein